MLDTAKFMFVNDDPYVLFLKKRKDRLFHVKPYSGNSGDCLIRMGTLLLLRYFNIETTVDPRKADTILWPGGNPSMWRGNVEGWKETWDRFPQKENSSFSKSA